MTLPASGQPIGVSNVNAEVGRASTTNASLTFLIGYIKPAIRPGTSNLGSFGGLRYYRQNNAGNCNNSKNTTQNCSVAGGNIQCYKTNNCTAVNCANCDTQSWLQTGDCQLSTTPVYNCTADQNCFTYNCNCSKIICTKLFDLGLMKKNIFEADQAFGERLQKTNPDIYNGYRAWAEIVVDWMDGKGPDFMVWIKDPVARKEAQKVAITKMAINIGTPWSEHMAFRMGALKQDNFRGKVLMTIGVPICRLLDKVPRVREKERRHRLPVLYAMWAAFFVSHWTAGAITSVHSFFEKFSVKEVSHAKID
jgi:hypothetical protein